MFAGKVVTSRSLARRACDPVVPNWCIRADCGFPCLGLGTLQTSWRRPGKMMAVIDRRTTRRYIRLAYAAYGALLGMAAGLAIWGEHSTGAVRGTLLASAAVTGLVTLVMALHLGAIVLIAVHGHPEHPQAPVRHQRVRNRLDRSVVTMNRTDQVLVVVASLGAAIITFVVVNTSAPGWLTPTDHFPFGPGAGLAPGVGLATCWGMGRLVTPRSRSGRRGGSSPRGAARKSSRSRRR